MRGRQQRHLGVCAAMRMGAVCIVWLSVLVMSRERASGAQGPSTGSIAAPAGAAGHARSSRGLFGDIDEDGDVDLDDHALFVACLEGPEVPVAPTPQTFNVSVEPALSFEPSNLVLTVNDTVHWFWAGGRHNVESGVSGIHDGNFRSGDSTTSTTVTFDVTFDEAFLTAHPMPGSVYPYYCVVHEAIGMMGTVTVNLPTCPQFDADGDGDVDLQDFKAFQETFTGS